MLGFRVTTLVTMILLFATTNIAAMDEFSTCEQEPYHTSSISIESTDEFQASVNAYLLRPQIEDLFYLTLYRCDTTLECSSKVFTIGKIKHLTDSIVSLNTCSDEIYYSCFDNEDVHSMAQHVQDIVNLLPEWNFMKDELHNYIIPSDRVSLTRIDAHLRLFSTYFDVNVACPGERWPQEREE